MSDNPLRLEVGGTYDFNKNSLCSYAFNIRIFSC